MLLTFDKFGGIAPKILDPVLLPDNRSQAALNCRFDRGGITPLKKDVFIHTPLRTAGPILSIYPYKYQGNTYFFTWASDVDPVMGPIANDSYDRVFYTEAGQLRVTDHSLFNDGGSIYPMSYRLPSPPAPVNAPSVSGSPSVSDPTLQETRYYVYTYVNTYGEEGPPSPVSNKLVIYDGNTVTVSGLDTGPVDNTLLAITHKRIYRTNQTAGTTAIFELVDEISIDTVSYSDTVLAADLAEPLPSAEWDGAPSGIQGLTALPNSLLAGFVENMVCFSVPKYPHAWPVSWQIPLEWPVVALGSYSSTLVALTTGQPYLIVFTDPSNTVPEQIELGLSCLSKRGKVQAGDVVVYPSPLGLTAIGPGIKAVLTQDVIDRDTWMAQYNPATINAYYWQAKYVGFYTNPAGQKAGFMFDMKTLDLVDLDFSATAGYYDPTDGALYLQMGSNISSLGEDSAYRTGAYTSKRHTFRPTALGAIKALADAYPLTIEVTYPDIARSDTVEIRSRNPHRLINVGEIEQCEISINNLGSEVSAVFLATTMEEFPL